MTDHLIDWAETFCQPNVGLDVFSCWLNTSAALRDLLLTFIWILILLYTSVAVKKTVPTLCLRPHESSVSRYSLHDVRWLLILTLLLVHLTDLAEALLVWKNKPTQITSIFLVVPVSNAFVVLVSCAYFDRIEVPYLHIICIQFKSDFKSTSNSMKVNVVHFKTDMSILGDDIVII